MRIGYQRGARFLEHGYGQLTAYGWEVVEEDFQGVPGFKVIEQSLDRHAGPSEYGRTAMNFRINGDESLVHGRAPSDDAALSVARGVFRRPTPRLRR